MHDKRGNGPDSGRLSEIADELREMQQEILGRIDEALDLLREAGLYGAVEQARAYWAAQVTIALTNDHGYLGGAGVSMDDAISGVDEAIGEAVEREEIERGFALEGWLEAVSAGEPPTRAQALAVEATPKPDRFNLFLEAAAVLRPSHAAGLEGQGRDDADFDARSEVDALHKRGLAARDERSDARGAAPAA